MLPTSRSPLENLPPEVLTRAFVYLVSSDDAPTRGQLLPLLCLSRALHPVVETVADMFVSINSVSEATDYLLFSTARPDRSCRCIRLELGAEADRDEAFIGLCCSVVATLPRLEAIVAHGRMWGEWMERLCRALTIGGSSGSLRWLQLVSAIDDANDGASLAADVIAADVIGLRGLDLTNFVLSSPKLRPATMASLSTLSISDCYWGSSDYAAFTGSCLRYLWVEDGLHDGEGLCTMIAANGDTLRKIVIWRIEIENEGYEPLLSIILSAAPGLRALAIPGIDVGAVSLLGPIGHQALEVLHLWFDSSPVTIVGLAAGLGSGYLRRLRRVQVAVNGNVDLIEDLRVRLVKAAHI